MRQLGRELAIAQQAFLERPVHRELGLESGEDLPGIRALADLAHPLRHIDPARPDIQGEPNRLGIDAPLMQIAHIPAGGNGERHIEPGHRSGIASLQIGTLQPSGQQVGIVIVRMQSLVIGVRKAGDHVSGLLGWVPFPEPDRIGRLPVQLRQRLGHIGKMAPTQFSKVPFREDAPNVFVDRAFGLSHSG